MRKSNVFAVVAGAVLTLVLWIVAFVILNAVYQGAFPWLATLLAGFLCPLAGGVAAGWMHRTGGAQLGALSGGSAGLIVLLVAAVASRVASNTTLAGVLAVAMGAISGGIGGYLMRPRRKFG